MGLHRLDDAVHLGNEAHGREDTRRLSIFGRDLHGEILRPAPADVLLGMCHQRRRLLFVPAPVVDEALALRGDALHEVHEAVVVFALQDQVISQRPLKSSSLPA